MTGACEPPAEQLCGCCTGLTQQTPEVITNRPALSSIAYRAGRYATFNASMLAALSDPSFPAVAPLRTRDTTDFSIALLDAWAVALDILTFYQERFANEAFLRTAVDQRAVIELAALIGYQPSPGVAASAVLAFTLSSAPGSPDKVLIPAGTRVQSVPGPGQTSQVFETSADLTAVIGWNALPAQTTIPWQLADTDTSTWITGTANNIHPGDALLFVTTQNGQPVATGPSDFHHITAVTTDTTVGSPTSGNTHISWDGTISSKLIPSGVTSADVGLYVFRKKAALYGVQAPNPATLSGPNLQSVPGYPLFPPSDLTVSTPISGGKFAAGTYYWTVTATNANGETSGSNEVSATLTATTSAPLLWNPVAGATAYNVYRGTSAGGENTLVTTVKTGETAYTDTGSAGTTATPPGVSPPHWQYLYQGGGQINLDATYPGLQPPASSSDGAPQWAVLTDPNGTTAVFKITTAAETSPNWYTLTAKTTQLTLAPYPPQTPDPIIAVQSTPQPAVANSPDPVEGFVADTPNVTAYVQSAPLIPAGVPLTTWNLQGQYPLQAGMLGPVAGTSVSVTGGQQIAANQPIGISGRALRLQVTAGTFVADGSSGGSQAATGQVFLIDAFPPVTDPDTPGNLLWAVTSVSGVSGSLSVPADAIKQLLPSAAADPLVGEAATVQSVTVNGDVSRLTLNNALSRIYDAATVAVNANAVEATNGQTVHEILGSGDGTNDALQFTLKQAPLTYLTAPAGSGAQSTLHVWVNNLQWHETANLLASGPADRAFVTSANAAGNTVVKFGNGVHGARTPTGTSNIRATYRKGIGSPGMVSAGQLTQPLDRPQGLSSVTNPSAASGAADPATAEQARASAPLPTLTIGRVVSLEDYQNYALAFAGISKALATWTWFGNIRGVFLTVAGENGTTLSSDDPVVTSLIGAIKLCGDPHVPLRVASYVPLLFTFTANIAVDQADYAPAQVLAQAWQNVSAAFAFDQRQLAQNVAASDIIETIQHTAGVIGVQLQSLARSGDVADGPVPPLLCAAGPAPPQGAQMLLLDPATQGSIGLWS